MAEAAAVQMPQIVLDYGHLGKVSSILEESVYEIFCPSVSRELGPLQC